ncbi:MAG: GatB/YqeY domain-containing protein [Clostridia bacterium]|nr:GatB/YqeY domain-containing protein [Deltaproteobacteria bacterium]
METSAIASRLDEDLKNAMRAKDQPKVAAIRQLRSKAQEAMNAPDFKGPADDGFYQKIIVNYSRMLEKGIADLIPAGDRGAPLRESYRNEIGYFQQFLPKLLDERETAAIVKNAVETLGVKELKEVGRVVGFIMKEHKGAIDPGLTRRLVEEALKA